MGVLLGLFLLPFAGVGIVALVVGLLRITQGNLREGLMLVIFGVVFAGLAAGLWALVQLGRRKLQEQEGLQARHPDQPWLWQRDWASGRIEDSSRGILWTSWIMALFWNLISMPAGILGVRAALREGNTAGYIALLFPTVGLGLLVWAIQSSLRYRKYGVSRLELSTIPGVIGGSLAGSVRVTTLLQPEAGFALSLSCIRRVRTGSGRNSSTRESILWQEESRASGEQSRDSFSLGTRIPFSFRVPADAASSDSSNPRDRILWRLEVSAGVPGVDYAAAFEVPVFSGSDLPTQTESNFSGDSEGAVLAAYRQPADSLIRVTTNRRGTEVWFPAGRNRGVALSLTAFTLLWTAIVGGLIYSDAPVLFPVVFGFFEVLLVLGTLQLWLGVSRVTADPRALLLAEGYGYPGRERRIAAGDIADVSVNIGMQAASKPYYDVVIVRSDGRQMTAGRSVRDKREAEWLAVTIKNALALKNSRLAPTAQAEPGFHRR